MASYRWAQSQANAVSFNGEQPLHCAPRPGLSAYGSPSPTAAECAKRGRDGTRCQTLARPDAQLAARSISWFRIPGPPVLVVRPARCVRVLREPRSRPARPARRRLRRPPFANCWDQRLTLWGLTPTCRTTSDWGRWVNKVATRRRRCSNRLLKESDCAVILSAAKNLLVL
jgi:hypothetical protein